MDLDEFQQAFLKAAGKHNVSLTDAELQQDTMTLFNELETTSLKPLWSQYEKAPDEINEEVNDVKLDLLNQIVAVQLAGINALFAKDDPTVITSTGVVNPDTRKLPLNLTFSIAMDQMKRDYMEDVTQVVVEGINLTGKESSESARFAIAFVCDGHGGKACAMYVAYNLLPTLQFVSQQMCTMPGVTPSGFNVTEALRITIARVAKAWDDSKSSDKSGCTLNGVVFDRFEMRAYVFNVGDSRTTVFNDATKKVIFKTKDHEIQDPSERKRIEGLTVTQTQQPCKIIFVKGDTQRVQGYIAMSRAIGDNYPDMMGCMSRDPDLSVVDLKAFSGVTFIIGSDGLYDDLTDKMVGEILYEKIYKNNRAAPTFIKILKALGEHDRNRGVDNCSVILVHLTK